VCTTPLEDLAAVGTAESGATFFWAVAIPTGHFDHEICTKLVSKEGPVFKLVV